MISVSMKYEDAVWLAADLFQRSQYLEDVISYFPDDDPDIFVSRNGIDKALKDLSYSFDELKHMKSILDFLIPEIATHIDMEYLPF